MEPLLKPLIDTHAYLGANLRWGVNASLETYQEKQTDLRKEGYDARFIAMSAGMDQNDSLATHVAEHPDLFAGITLQINPQPEYSLLPGYLSPLDLEKMIKKHNSSRRTVVALKLHTSLARTSLDHLRVKPYMEVAKNQDLSFIVHCGREVPSDYTSPEMIRCFLETNSDVRLILAHFGGLDTRCFEAAIQIVKEHPDRVFVNTAGLSGEDRRWELKGKELKQVVDDQEDRWTAAFPIYAPLFPSHSIVFGTDHGYLKRYTLHPASMLLPAQQRGILHDNARRAFNLE